MSITTLTYIHNLLIEEKNRKQKAFDLIKKMLRDAEETHAPNIHSIQNEYDEMRESLRKAERALDDFECHEWH